MKMFEFMQRFEFDEDVRVLEVRVYVEFRVYVEVRVIEIRVYRNSSLQKFKFIEIRVKRNQSLEDGILKVREVPPTYQLWTFQHVSI